MFLLQVLVIEKKNEDGTWPRQSHSKCVHAVAALKLRMNSFKTNSFGHSQVQYLHLSKLYNFPETLLQFVCHHFLHDNKWG